MQRQFGFNAVSLNLPVEDESRIAIEGSGRTQVEWIVENIDQVIVIRVAVLPQVGDFPGHPIPGRGVETGSKIVTEAGHVGFVRVLPGPCLLEFSDRVLVESRVGKKDGEGNSGKTQVRIL